MPALKSAATFLFGSGGQPPFDRVVLRAVAGKVGDSDGGFQLVDQFLNVLLENIVRRRRKKRGHYSLWLSSDPVSFPVPIKPAVPHRLPPALPFCLLHSKFCLSPPGLPVISRAATPARSSAVVWMGRICTAPKQPHDALPRADVAGRRRLIIRLIFRTCRRPGCCCEGGCHSRISPLSNFLRGASPNHVRHVDRRRAAPALGWAA
jgi:hypothetical protein